MHISALGREQFEYVVSLGSVSIIYTHDPFKISTRPYNMTHYTLQTKYIVILPK